MYVWCRYWQCCDDIVSISTNDLTFTSTCTCSVDIDNVAMISCQHRQLTFHTLLHVRTVSGSSILTMLWRSRVDINACLHVRTVSISSMLWRSRVDINACLHVRTVSISSMLWQYRVEIDNCILINLYMYLQLLLQTSKILSKKKKKRKENLLHPTLYWIINIIKVKNYLFNIAMLPFMPNANYSSTFRIWNSEQYKKLFLINMFRSCKRTNHESISSWYW
jgi:hypothetical protein